MLETRHKLPRIGWPSATRLAHTGWNRTLYLLALGALAAAPYGAAMGSWHGMRMAVYAAIKLPLMLIVTWILVLPFGIALTRTARWNRATMPLAEASAQTICGTGLALLALCPVTFLFTHTGPGPGPELIWDYRLLYLAHLGVVAVAGLIASGALRRFLHGNAGTPRLAHLGWVAVFAFVAGEVSWVLRPFLGNPLSPVTFLRADALEGNAYEMIFRDVLPALFRGMD